MVLFCFVVGGHPNSAFITMSCPAIFGRDFLNAQDLQLLQSPKLMTTSLIDNTTNELMNIEAIDNQTFEINPLLPPDMRNVVLNLIEQYQGNMIK